MNAQARRMLDLLTVPAKQRRAVRTVNDLELLITEGIPAEALQKVRETLGLSIRSFSPVVGISERTFISAAVRRGASRRLDPLVSDRLARIARIIVRAEEVFGSREKALRWIHKPVKALGGRAPFDKLATDPGASQVEDVLAAIEHGVYV